MKVIFQDIDGPLIPLRMYFTGARPFETQLKSFIYDPVAVGMVLALCGQFQAQVVFNSAHNENPQDIMRHQGTVNGFGNVLHEDCTTLYHSKIFNRYEAILEWLSRHPDVTDWIVIDDAEVHASKQVKVDYDVGMTIHDYLKGWTMLNGGVAPPSIIGINGQAAIYPDKIAEVQNG